MSRFEDRLIFRCEPLLREELEKIADVMNMSASSAMRIALQSFIMKNMSKVDAAKCDQRR